jgi:hypothetical protein
MRLRHWLLASLAVPVSLAALWGFPEIAEASIGVGVQAGPVRLGSIAHPGGNYQLPPVYVVDTGTEAELISLRIDQPTHGKGRGIPPSWVQGTDASVRLAAHQSARIPLSLAVPVDATPGTYLSDLVVGGSTVISSGQANFGAAAATTLEFRVAPGPAPGPWLPYWMWWALGGLLLLAVVGVAMRRSGLRIRIERRVPPAAQAVSARGPAASAAARPAVVRGGSRAVLALVTIAALGACGQPQSAAAPGAGASITISLKVVPTVRSVTVSPGTATFGSCGGGSASLNTQSTSSALGYPNGYCWVGSPGSGGRFPVTVTNTGIASYIEVSSGNAAPSDNGRQWSLCNLGSNPAVSCTGSSGLPAMDQYVLQSFASNGKQNADGLTGSPSCDADFGTAHQCWTVQGDNAAEGFRLIGPEAPDDSSTSWTVRITWEASPNL